MPTQTFHFPDMLIQSSMYKNQEQKKQKKISFKKLQLRNALFSIPLHLFSPGLLAPRVSAFCLLPVVLVELLYIPPVSKLGPFGRGLTNFMFLLFQFGFHLSHIQMLSQYDKRKEREEKRKCRKL